VEPEAKLYVIVRADLSPGLQIPQAMHAHREFAEQHRTLERAWYRASNTLAVLAVPHEQALLALVARAQDADVPLALFREPDLGHAATAVCLAPGTATRGLCKRLPLALKI
jgi:peptidyl-tRNA hydrolase